MKKSEKKETPDQQLAQKMLKSVLATEVLIDKILEMINENEKEIEDWPEDSHPNG